MHPIADQLLGTSGAQVAAAVRDAHGQARAGQTPLDRRHRQAAADRVCPPLDPDILWRIAIHEAGHLVVAHALGLPRPERADLQNTSGFVDVPTPLLESRQSAFNHITALMAGRAAEQVVLGEAPNGAGLGDNPDLAMATRLAAQARYRWGLEDRLVFRPAKFTDDDAACLDILERTLQEADRQAHMILDETALQSPEQPKLFWTNENCPANRWIMFLGVISLNPDSPRTGRWNKVIDKTRKLSATTMISVSGHACQNRTGIFQ